MHGPAIISIKRNDKFDRAISVLHVGTAAGRYRLANISNDASEKRYIGVIAILPKYNVKPNL